MAHLQFIPGDPRLVDQLVCELKSKGIFDQFRKECIADVDTRPAYQNLRQRVESSVATFLSRQIWKPDLNKNQLREKLRKHLLDGNYLEQGVERIVDQVVNPKVASVFIPQVEDLVYNYLGIPRKKASGPETSNGKSEDLLPTDLEAVSPGSVKSNNDKTEAMDTSESIEEKMEMDDSKSKLDIKEDSVFESVDKDKEESRLSGISELTIHDSDVSIDKSTITIPLPAEEIKLENIPAPENSPPNIKNKNIDLEKIDLPQEPNLSTDIPLPDEMPKVEGDSYFKPIALPSDDDDDTSSDSSLRRNMSPLTPIRNFNNENSCDAQQAFENDSDGKVDENKEPSSFRFTIEMKSPENSSDAIKTEKKEQPATYQFNTQVTQPNVTTFSTPLYDDSSNSNNLQIDYESDANSKATETTKVPEADHNSGDSKKDRKEVKKSSHKSSHSSRDSHRHSSSKDKRFESKHSSSRDSSRHDKKSKDDKTKTSNKERSSDKSDKKDSKDSSKHRTSSTHKSSSHKDSKHRSSSSSKHSSKDDRKSSSSSQKDKEKSSSDKSKDKSKDSKSSSKDKERKSSSKKSDEKENKEKKEKKEPDDHYSLSGRGNPNRRSTDRDSNDGSSSSKGSHNPSQSKSTETKKDGKSSSKSGSTSSSDSTSPSDNVQVIEAKNISQSKPVVRVDTHLETPVSTPPRLPFVPDVTLKKPRFAANLEEAKHMMKMRKFLEDEQKRMNQEAALLLEFQANVRPSLSQVYSSIPGPELEFACVPNSTRSKHTQAMVLDEPVQNSNKKNVTEATEKVEALKDEIKTEACIEKRDEIAETLIAMHQDLNVVQEDVNSVHEDEKIEQSNDAVIEALTDEIKPEFKEEKNEITLVQDKVGNLNQSAENKEKDGIVEAEKKHTQFYEITVITEELSEPEEVIKQPKKEIKEENSKDNSFKYFAEHEKYAAELERDKFDTFFKKYTETLSNKMYLVNCESYEENLIREASESFGQYEIVNYYKNGHLKLSPTAKNIVKNVNVADEITLPTNIEYDKQETPNRGPVLSPVKSECSFELSSDYDAKLEEMVSKTSKQQIMEIILGSAIDESPSKMPQIDYCTDSYIEENSMKRKISEIEGTVNNNRHVLKPNKMRKLSGSDQITSTTEDSEETANRVQNNTRSKYLGKARRVGLPKPKRANLPNSPSSDKSVENYEQHETPNGKMKTTPRSKVQRYDTSDLYKPKLHYLSRRNNIT